jgi:large subunit ribosomal protein L24
MKIKKGDKVVMIQGKDRGKLSEVERVIPKKNRAVVRGLNMAKKHVRPTQKNPKGGIIDQATPIDVSNLKLICPKCQKATRIGYQNTGDEKNRKCKKCGEII